MPVVKPRFDQWTSQDGYKKLFKPPCFFALLPSGETTSTILQIAKTRASTLQLGWNRYGQPNSHVTLCTLEKMVRVTGPPVKIRDAANTVKFEGFDVRFDRVQSYDLRRGQHALVLQADRDTTTRVRSFASTLATAMLYGAGILVSPVSSIQPHITLLYDPRCRDVSEPIAPIQWRVNEFALIRSHFGYKEHEILGKWPLGT